MFHETVETDPEEKEPTVAGSLLSAPQAPEIAVAARYVNSLPPP